MLETPLRCCLMHRTRLDYRAKVYQDLLRKNGWAGLRPLAIDLPPCACCHQESSPGQQSHETLGTSRPSAQSNRCGSTAHGIAGTVEGEDSGHSKRNGDDGSEVEAAAVTKVVFAVNAGSALPTRRSVATPSASAGSLVSCRSWWFVIRQHSYIPAVR